MSTNKQPFYHRAVVLFTATEEISEKEFKNIVRAGVLFPSRHKAILPTSVEVEEIDAEPGDPADLL